MNRSDDIKPTLRPAGPTAPLSPGLPDAPWERRQTVFYFLESKLLAINVTNLLFHMTNKILFRFKICNLTPKLPRVAEQVKNIRKVL